MPYARRTVRYANRCPPQAGGCRPVDQLRRPAGGGRAQGPRARGAGAKADGPRGRRAPQTGAQRLWDL